VFTLQDAAPRDVARAQMLRPGSLKAARYPGLRGRAAPGMASGVQARVNSRGLAEAELVLRQCAGSGAAQRAAGAPARVMSGTSFREIRGRKRPNMAFEMPIPAPIVKASGFKKEE